MFLKDNGTVKILVEIAFYLLKIIKNCWGRLRTVWGRLRTVENGGGTGLGRKRQEHGKDQNFHCIVEF